MPQISVPKDFFRTERDTVYANWQTSFWRELISNSLDAGAKQIRIRTGITDDGNFRVDFADDGCGMDRDIIENVYMRLGGTTKGGADGTVGGFGRARLLTCFSHESYKIRSKDIVVTGAGADYDIRHTSNTVRGTAVSVDIEGRYAYRLMRGLRRALRQSSLRVPILMDLCQEDREGRLLNPFEADQVDTRPDGKLRFSAWSRKGKHFADMANDDGVWAQLHVSRGKTALPNTAVVRVGGIAMYDEHISVPVQVTVDLVPERSREVLTASRDSIRGEYRQELQKFFAKLAADQDSTFRTRAKDPETHVSGARNGTFGFSMPSKRSPAQPVRPEMPAEASEHSKPVDRRPAMQQPGGVAAEAAQNGRPSDPKELDLLRLPVALFIDNPSSEQRATIPRYRSTTWTEAGGQGRNAELLHAAWTGACRYMLETLSRAAPEVQWSDSMQWVTGFVFDENVDAMHKSFGVIRHGLLINPVDKEGRQRFKLSDNASLKRMGALAAHEVAHCLYDWHDEKYAALLTELMAESADKDLIRAMSDEMDLTREWQKARRTIEQSAEAQPACPEVAALDA